MKIYSVLNPEFKPYGKVLEGYDTSALLQTLREVTPVPEGVETAELVAAMKGIAMPESGTSYEPAIPALEACGIFGDMENRVYGGMPVQIGMC